MPIEAQAVRVGPAVRRARREKGHSWVDSGSNAWRASVYNFSAPPKQGQSIKVGTGDERDPAMKAYRSCVAYSHRSQGTYSTIRNVPAVVTAAPTHLADVTSMPGQRSRSDAEELYSKYPMTFAQSAERRSVFASKLGTDRPPLSLSTDSTRSLQPSAFREVPILKKGAEGRLLVPDVKMRRYRSQSMGGLSAVGGRGI